MSYSLCGVAKIFALKVKKIFRSFVSDEFTSNKKKMEKNFMRKYFG